MCKPISDHNHMFDMQHMYRMFVFKIHAMTLLKKKSNCAELSQTLQGTHCEPSILIRCWQHRTKVMMIQYTMGHKVFHVRTVYSFLSCFVSVEIKCHQYFFFVLHEPVTISMYWFARQIEEQDIAINVHRDVNTVY
jgi:hypothetical protein